jgi:hypothetical protein
VEQNKEYGTASTFLDLMFKKVDISMKEKLKYVGFSTNAFIYKYLQ